MGETYKVYAKPDENGYVAKVFSTCFEQPDEKDVLLKEGTGDEFVHVQKGYRLYDEHGRHNYKIADGALVKIAEADKPAIPVPPKSEMEQIRETLDMVIVSMLGGGSDV